MQWPCCYYFWLPAIWDGPHQSRGHPEAVAMAHDHNCFNHLCPFRSFLLPLPGQPYDRAVAYAS